MEEVNLLHADSWLSSHLHDRRFWRNIFWNLVGWTIVNTVFYVEVKYFGVGKAAAHASKTPIGEPLGVMIQGVVFGDRLKLIVKAGDWRPKLAAVVRWTVSKGPSVLINQALFWALVIRGGLPFWLAPLILSPGITVARYFIDLHWTFKVDHLESKTETA